METLLLRQVTAEDGQFLHKQQAAQAEDERFLRNFVTSPHHVCFEARRLGLVLVQEQQRLRRGGGALGVLDGGQGFVTGSGRILQQG